MVDNIVFQLRDFADRAPDFEALPRPQLRDLFLLSFAMGVLLAGVL